MEWPKFVARSVQANRASSSSSSQEVNSILLVVLLKLERIQVHICKEFAAVITLFLVVETDQHPIMIEGALVYENKSSNL